jgi:hypothetical protein
MVLLMAFWQNPKVWYINGGDGASTRYFALQRRINSFAYLVGEIVRQGIDPPVNNERAFICGFAGVTDVAGDATWNLGRGALTNDGTVRWYECTGQASMCGDLASTLSWADVRAIGIPIGVGAIIKRNNLASYQLCTVGGNFGATEPAFSDTIGNTTVDGSVTWTCLGPPTNYPKAKAPFPRLASAFATNWQTDGDTFYVGSDHTEIQPIQLLQPIQSQQLCKILCHNVSGNYPPIDTDLRTGAVISSSQSISNSFRIVPASAMYFYGISMRCAVGGSLGGSIFSIARNPIGYISNYVHLEACALELAENLDGHFEFSQQSTSGPVYLEMNNTTVKFKNTIQYIQPFSPQWVWTNTLGAVVGPTFPTTLVKSGANSNVLNILFEGLDLSAFPNKIYDQTAGGIGSFTVKDCKLHASATFGTPMNTGFDVRLINSDSGSVTTRLNTAKYNWEGTETTDNNVTRTGTAVGPSEFKQSRKVVTTAGIRWERPFKSIPLVKWNDKLNVARTVTIYLNIESLDVPNNDEVWLEVNYLSSSSYPLSTTLTTTKATFLSPNTPGLSDDSVWSNAALGRTPIKLTATFTARMAGDLTFTVLVAKPSTTIWIDPVFKLV